MKKGEEQKLILKVGAAGGSLSVWSVNTKDGTPFFVVKTDESTLKEFMDEEDANGLSFKSETGALHSFADTLIVLGRDPWHLFSPLFVHQDYIDPVLRAVMNLGGEKEVNRWRRKLEGSKAGL
ncbi:MAG: hypothetical protein NTY86_22665 [Deltaproteobacteria bacterium]|nr:hypothetical protein [Deltaproteobacteria bacterium]